MRNSGDKQRPSTDSHAPCGEEGTVPRVRLRDRRATAGLGRGRRIREISPPEMTFTPGIPAPDPYAAFTMYLSCLTFRTAFATRGTSAELFVETSGEAQSLRTCPVLTTLSPPVNRSSRNLPAAGTLDAQAMCSAGCSTARRPVRSRRRRSRGRRGPVLDGPGLVVTGGWRVAVSVLCRRSLGMAAGSSLGVREPDEAEQREAGRDERVEA